MKLSWIIQALALVTAVGVGGVRLAAQDVFSAAGSEASSGLGQGLAPATISATGQGGELGRGGGAAMADFDTLMNLIQQTIDPDSWLVAGGTSSILPYPSGVYVDPQGHLQRLMTDGRLEPDLPIAAARAPRHPWRETSPLRTVSLRGLERAIEHQTTHGLRATRELLSLAGLSRIEYVRINMAEEDILLSGPAGEPTLGFHLQDLALVASLVGAQTTPLGCSIEPDDSGIRAAQALLQRPQSAQQLARNPALIVEQLQDRLGPHRVRVFGMRPTSGTALALLDADEHMKKVAFGQAAARSPVTTYWEHLERQTAVPSQSLIRWWFAYADEPLRVNAQGDLFQLPPQCVAVLSEQQWVDQQGRAPSGGNDPAADAFAQGFTEQLAVLRRTHPAYARLCAVFESALALQLSLEASGQGSVRAWFPRLCALGQIDDEQAVQPRSVEGLTAWHKLKNGTVVAVVSGGVQIDSLQRAAREQWQQSPYLAASQVPQQAAVPSPAHAAWWWD
ncbi:MAG: DUF1598 domain-containing protein [Planctomycetales bacterium]|nr:DUF1598 domain-containing protein [Planctomycetales bacterium]